ncbi:MAG: gliding motility-associated-like protein [Luteibaculaceae bacterium]|jgi:gliding motility-associated-like protein
MKRFYSILFSVAFFGFGLTTEAQECIIEAFASPLEIPCGNPVTLTAVGKGTVRFSEDFNDNDMSSWSNTPTGSIKQNGVAPPENNDCDVPTPEGDYFLWFDGSANSPRSAATPTIDLTNGGSICFYLRMSGNEFGAPNCENPDAFDEGVYLQYRVGAGAWTDIDYFDPRGGLDAERIAWTQYCRDIPVAARNNDVKIRWIQLVNSNGLTGEPLDHWGIDGVEIEENLATSGYDWTHDALIGYQPTGATPNVFPTVNTTYTVKYTVDGGTTVCTQSVSVVVKKGIAGANVDKTVICPGDPINFTTDWLVDPILPPPCGVNSDVACDPVYSASGAIQVGFGNNVTTSGNCNDTPFGTSNCDGGLSTQILYRANELVAQGFEGGKLTSISFEIASVDNGYNKANNFKLWLGCVPNNALGDELIPSNNLYRVFEPKNVTFSPGWQKFDFDQAYDWDGVSNLLLMICWNNPQGQGTRARTRDVTLAWNCLTQDGTNSAGGANFDCWDDVFHRAGSRRPNTKFTTCVRKPKDATFVWTSNPNDPTFGPNNSLTPDAGPVTPGSYTYTVKGNYAGAPEECATTDQVTVTVQDAPDTPVPTSNSPICERSTIQLDFGTTTFPGGSTFQWRHAGSAWTSTTEDPTRAGATAAMAGDYFVRVNTSAGCPSAEGKVTISINPAPAANAATTAPVCENAPFNVTTTVNGVNYAWTGPSGFTSTVKNTTFPSGDPATHNGAYTLVTTNTTTGCTSLPATVNVTINPAQAPLPLDANPLTLCEGDDLVLSSTVPNGLLDPQVTFLFGGPDGWTGTVTGKGAQTVTRTAVPASGSGQYWLVGTGNGCPSDTAFIDVVVISPANINATSTGPYCEGEKIELSVDVSGATYAWNGPGGYTANTQNPDRDPSVVAHSGTYTVDVTISGCTSQASVDVSVVPAPGAPADQTLDYCVGDAAAALTPSGATFLWYTTAVGGTGSATAPAVSTASAGTTTHYVSEKVGNCESPRGQIDITVTDPATVSTDATADICAGETVQLNGSFGGSASSGTWTAGAGTYAPDNTTGNAVYTPTAGEEGAGSLTLTFTSDDPAGACPAVFATTDITITPMPTDPADQTIDLCEGDAALALTPSGVTFLWYTVASGGTPLGATPTINTSSTGTTIYYVSEKNGDCESGRGTVTINIEAAPTVNAGADKTICEGETITLNGSIGGGATSAAWTGGAGTYAPSSTDLTAVYTPDVSEVTAGSVTLNLTASGSGGACPDVSKTVTFTISKKPSITNVVRTCNPTNTGYVVTFDVVNGVAPFNLVAGSDPGTFSGATFTSSELVTGATYTYTINDTQGCGPVTITDNFACNCGTDAGTTSNTGGVIPLCEGSTYEVQHNGDETLDGDDVLAFTLHDNAGNFIILQGSNSFGYDAGTMTFGTIYYISAIAASDVDANGLPETSDPCKDVTDGQQVVWYPIPSATITGGGEICKGEGTNVQFDFTGFLPYDLYYHEDQNPQTEMGINSNQFVLNISNPTNRVTQYTLDSIVSQGCVADYNDFVLVTVKDSMEAVLDSTVCDGTGENYLVYISMMGGDTLSYRMDNSTTGHTGAVTGTQFVSNPIPDGATYSFQFNDDLQCHQEPIIISGDRSCDCQTAIGTLNSSGNPLVVCGAASYTLGITYNSAGEYLDPNDNKAFYLHNGDATNLGTILAGPVANPGQFNFTSITGGVYGTTYYIIGVAGNAQGTGVDFSDKCAQFSNGTPVIFNQEPQANLFTNGEICQSDKIEVSLSFTGPGPYIVTGTADIQGTYTGDSVVEITPTAPGVFTYTIDQVGNGQCANTTPKTASVTVISSPVVDSTIVPPFTCATDNNSYTVTFYVTGGSSTNYQITGTLGNGDPIGGSFDAGDPTLYTSNAIPNGIPFTFDVSEVGKSCPPYIFTASHLCPCETAVGDMLPLTTPTPLCGVAIVSAGYDKTNENFDGNDGTQFIFTDDPTLGTIIQKAGTPNFDLSAEITGGSVLYNTSYYIMAITGDMNNGDVDLNTPCLQKSNAIEVTFFPSPTADISSSIGLICQNSQFPVDFTFTGTPGTTFSVVVTDGTNTVASSSNIENGGSLQISPPNSGSFTYEIDSIVDNISGCVAKTFGVDITGQVNIQVNPAPTVQIAGTDDFCFDITGNIGVVQLENFSGSGPFDVFVSDNLTNTFAYSVSGADSTVNLALDQDVYLLKSTTFKIDSIRDQSPQQCLGLGDESRAQFNVQPIPDLDLSITDVFVCEGSPVTITGSNTVGTGGLSVSIDGPAGFNQTQTATEGQNVTFSTIFPPVGTNVYTVSLLNDQSALSCGNVDSVYTVTVDVNPTPTVDISIPAGSQICHGDSITLIFDVTGNGLISFMYSDGLGNNGTRSVTAGTDTVLVGPTNISSAVQYSTFTVSNVQDNSALNCPGTATGSAVLQVNSIPTVNVTIDDPEICFGDNTILNFSGTGNGPLNVQWTDGITNNNTIVTPGSASPEGVAPTTTTNYGIISVTDASNPSCINNTNMPNIGLIVNQLPIGTISGVDSLCYGEIFNFDLNLSGNPTFAVEIEDENGVSYPLYTSLFNGLNLSSILPTGTHTYSIVSITDGKGCVNTGTGAAFVEIFPAPTPDFSLDINASCPPFDVQFTNLTDPQFLGDGALVTWTLGAGQISNRKDSAFASYTNPGGGIYTVSLEVTSPVGCYTKLDSINLIEVFPMPTADFSFLPSKPDLINPNVRFYDNSEIGDMLNWTFIVDSSIFETNEIDPYYNFPSEDEGVYTVCQEAVTINGCVDTLCRDVKVLGLTLINIPNTFTPNSDGFNDVFKPVLSGYKKEKNEYEFIIFNRWGEVIFETKNPDLGWNGTFKGNPAPEGTYLYRVILGDSFSTDKGETIGNVQLLR